MEETRVCKKCFISKPIDMFYIYGAPRKDGSRHRRLMCNKCFSAYQSVYQKDKRRRDREDLALLREWQFQSASHKTPFSVPHIMSDRRAMMAELQLPQEGAPSNNLIDSPENLLD